MNMEDKLFVLVLVLVAVQLFESFYRVDTLYVYSVSSVYMFLIGFMIGINNKK